MSVNSADRSQGSSYYVRGIENAKNYNENQSSMLLGRRLEVFRPGAGQWVTGLVVKEIRPEIEDENIDDVANIPSKWLVKLDNNESICFDSLRGNVTLLIS
jgi:hypothetical protein